MSRPAEPSDAPHPVEIRHASTVAIGARAVMIQGPSGSGKSGLALELISRGAVLIADDQTRLVLRDDWPWVLAPEPLAGVIEARGVGLIRTPYIAGAPLSLIIDMAEPETTRLPEPATETVLGHDVMHLRRVDAAYFPGAIMALVKGGYWADV